MKKSGSWRDEVVGEELGGSRPESGEEGAERAVIATWGRLWIDGPHLKEIIGAVSASEATSVTNAVIHTLVVANNAQLDFDFRGLEWEVATMAKHVTKLTTPQAAWSSGSVIIVLTKLVGWSFRSWVIVVAGPSSGFGWSWSK